MTEGGIVTTVGAPARTVLRPGAAGAEQFLARAFVVLRTIQLAQSVVVLATNPHAYRPQALAYALYLGQLTWSGWLIHRVLREQRFTDRRLAGTDILIAAAEVAALALIAKGPGAETWTNWAFAIGTSAVMGAGAAFPAAPALLASTSVALAHLAGAAHALSTGAASSSNATGNSLSYLGFTLIVVILARQIRRTGAQIDAATDRAILAETQAAITSERLDHYRHLHNGALATLTLIGSGSLDIDRDAVQDRARRDAQGLRALIESDPDGTSSPTSLSRALADLAIRRRAEGLPLDYRGDRLPDDTPPVVREALLSAVSEALTNAAKHAPDATVHLTASTLTPAPTAAGGSGAGSGRRDGLQLTIYDTGPGYNPATITPGRGLDRVITAPIEALGGTTTITTGPDGTLIEICWSPA